MNPYIFQVINGIGIGMVYFLLSVGLSIIFGLLGFVNFAHGALYLVGAYVAVYVAEATGSFWWSLVAAFAGVGLLGVAAERLVLRRSYSMPHEAQILLTVGLALVLNETVVLIAGPEARPVQTPDFLQGVQMLGAYPVPTYRLFIAAVCALTGLGLWLLFERTLFGARVRAGSESPEMLRLLGTRITGLYAATFALGCGLAGLAGALAAPLRGADPSMGAEAIVIAFVVVVLGGMGSFTGPLAGGLLIGVTQSVMSALWPEGARLMIFLLMAAVLLLMPKGLFGRV